tara:strand:+ start:164 stop:538 length:375 start_codon:yes stop_codon:yes gene_type:complete
MTDKKFTKDHEWILVDGEIGTVGITNHAQDSLGDIVFIELPKINIKVQNGEEVSVIESVKAASDIYSPIDGEIIEVNNELTNDPAIINKDSENSGWIFKIKISDKKQLDDHMDLNNYLEFIKNS